MNQAPTEYLFEEQEKPIDFKYYLYLFRKNFTNILTFFLIAVTLGAIYASKIPDRFQTSAQIIIEKPVAERGTLSQSGSGMQGEKLTEDYYLTEMEIMKSMTVMLPVVDSLKLLDYFGIDNEEDAANRIRNMVTIKRVGESRIFYITVNGLDAQLVTNIANGVARAYIRKNFENSLYYSKEILNWLPKSAGGGDEIITITDPDGSMRQMKRDDLMETLPAFQGDPTLRELREKKGEMESEILLLKRQYREKHPLMIKARANLKFVDETIDKEKMRIVEDLRSQAEGQHKLGNARLVEEAKVPKAPLPNKREKIVIIIALAELILSFLLIMVMDFFDHSIKNVEDLERKGVSMPFLGHLPLIKKKQWESDKNDVSIHKDVPELGEAFRYVRVAINFSGSPESLKVLVFSSCLPHEGKSFTSHNIAISLALDGNKTLLVDADLRRPVVHKRFKTENTIGLSNYLTSNIEFDSILKESYVENLTLVLSGPTSPNPTEILGSDRMKKFLEEARKRYDRIIIDCPPLTGIGDGVIVGSLVGQIILVISAGKTPIDLIKANQKQLDKAHVKVMGTILNMVDVEKERVGGYHKYYHHTYNRYYSNPGGDQAKEA